MIVLRVVLTIFYRDFRTLCYNLFVICLELKPRSVLPVCCELSFEKSSHDDHSGDRSGLLYDWRLFMERDRTELESAVFLSTGQLTCRR